MLPFTNRSISCRKLEKNIESAVNLTTWKIKVKITLSASLTPNS